MAFMWRFTLNSCDIIFYVIAIRIIVIWNLFIFEIINTLAYWTRFKVFITLFFRLFHYFVRLFKQSAG